ncbi:RES domain-containing protein [Sandarakinorhabdus sp.]|uniref:RES domain-containing protein n=1 Tax=Sandarakinorhabdus sp. TaxID=1916663 RepID=UPI003F7003FC
MKLTRLRPNAVFHRYLTPRWSHAPLSGAGAALHGGRFNRPGVPALYLSLGRACGETDPAILAAR